MSVTLHRKPEVGMTTVSYTVFPMVISEWRRKEPMWPVETQDRKAAQDDGGLGDTPCAGFFPNT